ncbi:MAG: hypothetical protein ACXQTP_00550 [Candidatus Methanofastidiosia archaeon]
MEQEKSIARIVDEIIDSLPLIGDYLVNDIINYNGLARWIYPEVERRANKKVSIESISVAIQRYHFHSKVGEYKKLSDALAKTKLMLKSDITNISYLKNYKLIKRIDEFSERIRWEYGENFFTVQSSQEISAVLERDRLDEFMKFTSPYKPLSLVENVTIINCRYPKYIVDIPGYLYSLLRVITLEKLNVIDIFSTFTEFIFLFRDKDALKAYEALGRLIKDARSRELR